MAKLDGKVAVITGASSGIGEATAEALSAERATVVVAARREARLDDLVGRINGNGGQALAVECDVTDEEQAHALIQRAKDEFGRVDVLVNNAGVMLLSKIEKELSEEWRQMFDVRRRFQNTKPYGLRFCALLGVKRIEDVRIEWAVTT
jgi:NADP-dependent 3-hydroxy acid dehydrogenase YdfG